MRSDWIVFVLALALTASCDLLTTANPEYCDAGTPCPSGYVCHPTRHRCEAGPVLLSIDPAIGPSTGNIDVKLSGMNFGQGVTVAFNDIPAAVTRVTAEEIHATLPPNAGACGPVLVRIATPDGYRVESSSLFRYKYGNLHFVPVANPPTVDTNARSILAARVDGDAVNDLVVTNSASNTLSVFRGVGDLTFTSMAAFGSVYSYTSASVADLNADGVKDLVASSTANFVIFQGQAGLTFTQKNQFVYSNKGIVIANFTSDDKPDILLLNGLQNQLDLYVNSGGFIFVPQLVRLLPGPSSAMAAADVNGDGKMDIAVLDDSGGAVLVLLGRGDGTFLEPSLVSTGPGPSLLSTADLNSDGKPDLVFVTSDGTQTMLAAAFGQGDGTFRATATLPIAMSPKLLSLDDIDCDGQLDALIYHQGGTLLSAYVNRGGTQGFATPVSMNTGAVVGSLALALLDADRRPDIALLTSTTPASLVLLRNASD